MYDLIYSFINHVWQTGTNQSYGDQPYIYAAAIIITVILTVVIIDLVRDVFSRFLR